MCLGGDRTSCSQSIADRQLISLSAIPSCLAHRLRQWLSTGSDLVQPQLHRLKYPCLVIAGTVDNLLPSYEEAGRLQRELPDCQVRRRGGVGLVSCRRQVCVCSPAASLGSV